MRYINAERFIFKKQNGLCPIWFNMEFVNDLKHIVVLIAAIIFLLITMFITIRQVRILPLSYTIQILGNQEEKIMLPDLRLHFRRYEVAESYARFYRDMFRQQQYKFKVIGIKKWGCYVMLNANAKNTLVWSGRFGISIRYLQMKKQRKIMIFDRASNYGTICNQIESRQICWSYPT